MPSRNILVINCGSSSIKFALVNEAHSLFPLHGLAERLGSRDAVLRWKRGGDSDSLMIPNADHRAALAQLLPMVQNAAGGKLHGIGHRVVHGGELFTHATRIDDRVVEAIRATAPLAPLHNPANLQGIEAAMTLFPKLPHVAVFDTASTRACRSTPTATPCRKPSTASMAYAATASTAPATATSATAPRKWPGWRSATAVGSAPTSATAVRPAPSSTARASTPAWA